MQEGPKTAVLAAEKSVVTKQEPVEAQEESVAPEVSAEADASNAKQAASVARQAAKVANKVAEHSVHIVKHSQKALHHALGALHDARVDTQGLTQDQKDSLKKAEGRLREATKKADYGKLQKVEDQSALDRKKAKMQEEIEKIEAAKAEKKALTKKVSKQKEELEQLRSEVKHMRKELAEKGGDAEEDKALHDMEDMLNNRKESDKNPTNDELKAEVESLKEQIDKMEKHEAKEDAQQAKEAKEAKEAAEEEEKEELMRDVEITPLKSQPKKKKVVNEEASQSHIYDGVGQSDGGAVTVESKGIDIDTQMPYGDLEPFGREDTAQELTESSVRESDAMVDQLERAEVAEEKRAVFRALTRLRGAAITSFDGVARAQTGNIDEYNKVHKWRQTHPLRHLADEESDVAKWAFPDNADFF